MPPKSPFSLTDPDSAALGLLRLARTTACERFPQKLLERLVALMGADHGAINIWHPRSFVASVGVGYDLSGMSADWYAIGGAELDFTTPAMHAQPLRAVCVNDDDPRWKQSHPSWRSFQARYGIHHQLGVSIPFEGSETFAHCYLNRGAASPRYGTGEVDALTALAPGIGEALLINRLYAGARQGLEDTGSGEQPLAVTDNEGWILFPNADFCRAWPRLSEIAWVSEPRLPKSWLEGERGAIRKLHAAGWQCEVTPAHGGLRVALRRNVQGAGAMLTPRQTEISRLYCAGYSGKDIATRLRVSPATVRVHLRETYLTLGVTSRSGLRSALGL